VIYKINEEILEPMIRLIDNSGNQAGVVNTTSALLKAKELGVDLVKITSTETPPVCKLIDYNKFKYIQSKKRKNNIKKSKESRIITKELYIRPATNEHDINIKIRKAIVFLQKNNKVKFTMKFKGRESTHKEIGINILNNVVTSLKNYIKKYDMTETGNNIILLLEPLKNV